MKALASVGLALLLLTPAQLRAQGTSADASALARADSLLSSGEGDSARDAYRQVLERDPGNTRAIFGLARSLQGSAEAVVLLRRYTALEPDDAWGYWALAEALDGVGQPKEGVAAYAEALKREPGERDFWIGQARLLVRGGYRAQAIQRYEGWISRQPGDAEALRELAEQLRKSNRPGAAASALERSLRLQPDARAEERLRALRMELAPTLEPVLRVSRDSDGNTTLSTRVAADLRAADGLRIGVLGGRVRSADALAASSAWEGAVGVDWRSGGAASVRGQTGVAVIGASQPGPFEVVPILRLRTRWRPAHGPSAELRLQHEPVSSTPLLLSTPVVLSEAHAAVDLPIAGPLYARAMARAGLLRADVGSNLRTGASGGGVLRLGEATEIGTLYHRTRYAEPAQAAYFAPERIEAVEFTAYTEYYGAWPLTLSLDGGVGGERVTDWNQAAGKWQPAFRLWSQLSWSIRPGRELRLEAEAYETRAGPTLAPTAAGWRWGSVALSLRTAIR